MYSIKRFGMRRVRGMKYSMNEFKMFAENCQVKGPLRDMCRWGDNIDIDVTEPGYENVIPIVLLLLSVSLSGGYYDGLDIQLHTHEGVNKWENQEMCTEWSGQDVAWFQTWDFCLGSLLFYSWTGRCHHHAVGPCSVTDSSLSLLSWQH